MYVRDHRKQSVPLLCAGAMTENSLSLSPARATSWEKSLSPSSCALMIYRLLKTSMSSEEPIEIVGARACRLEIGNSPVSTRRVPSASIDAAPTILLPSSVSTGRSPEVTCRV